MLTWDIFVPGWAGDIEGKVDAMTTRTKATLDGGGWSWY
jgi:hypothetical protein